MDYENCMKRNCKGCIKYSSCFVVEENIVEENIFYFRKINLIGGIETFFYELAKKYCDLDITIYYNQADAEQLKRLKKLVRCKRYNGEYIKCKKAFFNFNLDIIDNVEAEEYIQILHGDYKAMGIIPNTHKKITRYIGVSKLACDSFYKITGKKAELCYNPISVEKTKRVLKLISATRLTKEKGKDRIIKLAQLLDNRNIPYEWLIFTDDRNIIENKSIVYMNPRLDIRHYIANADYLVQLSDNEGYCYSIVEALTLKVPVIITNLPIASEIGVENNKNGYILDFNLNNVDIDKIYNNIPKFIYIPKEDIWNKYLAGGKSKYKEELAMKYEVEALDTYEKNNIKDAVLGRVIKTGERFIVDKERLDVLLGENSLGLIFVKEIEKKVETAVKKETKEKAISKTKKK